MGDGVLDGVWRLSGLLRDRPALLVERWERLVAGPRGPALRDRALALVVHLAARIEWGARRRAGSPDPRAAEPEPPAWDALGELVHLRRALFELCAAEGVLLEGEALLVVHEALDDAILSIAGAIERRAVVAGVQQQERLEQALRLLPVGVFLADAQGHILTINEAATRIWGAGVPFAQSSAGYGAYRAYRPGSNEPLAAEDWGLARVLEGEEVPDEEVEIVSFDGDRRTIVNFARALHDASGRVTGGVAVNVDVTDRKRTELRLAAIIEGALDAIVLIDASGRITEFNAAAERTFGYTRGEAIGRELADLVIEPGMREAHRRGLARFLATGETRIIGRRIELRAMRAGGALFDVELTVTQLPTDAGCPVAFAGFVRDISDRRRAEQERARETEFRERFLDILGHDLRTPLTAILFAAHGLHRREGLSDMESKGLDRILRSAQRMERMIHDLLDFARARHAGGIPVKPEAGDLAATCRHVIDELASSHPGRAIEIRSRGSAHGRWDPDRISQVVQNLVGNALDYSPPDTPVRVAIDGEGESVVLTVSNGGAPIPPEVIPDLFDPFRRGAHAAGPAPRGLGLGLYIAREIVCAHHGRMSVASDEAAGTTFTVELPRADGTPADYVAAPQSR